MEHCLARLGWLLPGWLLPGWVIWLRGSAAGPGTRRTRLWTAGRGAIFAHVHKCSAKRCLYPVLLCLQSLSVEGAPRTLCVYAYVCVYAPSACMHFCGGVCVHSRRNVMDYYCKVSLLISWSRQSWQYFDFVLLPINMKVWSFYHTCAVILEAPILFEKRNTFSGHPDVNPGQKA